MANSCELCGGRGLEIVENGFATFCRECYGFGSIIDPEIVEFCQFGFFTARLENAWDMMMKNPIQTIEMVQSYEICCEEE